MSEGIQRRLGDVKVATDFTPGALAAVERATLLPFGLGATLGLVHVVEAGRSDADLTPVEAEARRRLEKLRGEVVQTLHARGDPDRDVTVQVERGRPSAEVLRSARAASADLIVLGRHGARTFREMVMGTTAERLVRDGDVSVLVVTEGPVSQYRRPLVAVDLSDSSRLALELALRLVPRDVETIGVVHALAPQPGVYAAAGALPVPMPNTEADERRARAELADFLSGFTGRKLEVVVRTGDPRAVVLGVAKERGADLIALGTHGRAGLAHAVLGSVAEGVMRASACDVLIAKAPRADLRT